MCRSPAGGVGRLARSSTVPDRLEHRASGARPVRKTRTLTTSAARPLSAVVSWNVASHRVALGVVQRQPRRPQRVGLARLLHWRFGLTGDEPAGGADACTYGRTPASGRERTGIDHRWELTLLRSRAAREPSQRRSAQQIQHHCADGSCRVGHVEREAGHLQIVIIGESDVERLVKHRRPWIHQDHAPAAVSLPVGEALVRAVLTDAVVRCGGVEVFPLRIQEDRISCARSGRHPAFAERRACRRRPSPDAAVAGPRAGLLLSHSGVLSRPSAV